MAVLKALVNGVWEPIPAGPPGPPGTPGSLDAWIRWTGTQAEYDAIATKDPTTLYVIVP
jgi:hypothetical protein